MAKSAKSQAKTRSTETEIVETIVRGFAGAIKGLFSLLTKGKYKKSVLSKSKLQELQNHWEQVELWAVQPDFGERAISEADKLLDSVFKILKISGQTMGERLKAAESKFESSHYQDIWEAHKVRNRIAHEVGTTIPAAQIKKSLSAYRQAFYELGILS